MVCKAGSEHQLVGAVPEGTESELVKHRYSVQHVTILVTQVNFMFEGGWLVLRQMQECKGFSILLMP